MKMECLVFEIELNLEVSELIDNRVPFIVIPKFSPNNLIEWKSINLVLSDNVVLKNTLQRNLEVDLQTNLEDLHQILKFQMNQIVIYQFDKPISNTLEIDRLPPATKLDILMKNGLKHIFTVDFEVLTIESSDMNFLNNIKNSPVFAQKIETWKSKAIKNMQ